MSGGSKIGKRIVHQIPITQYINRSDGGNVWSMNLHSSYPFNWSLNPMTSTHKVYDTCLGNFHYYDNEVSLANPSKKPISLKKNDFKLKNMKDKIVTTHIKGIRLLNA